MKNLVKSLQKGATLTTESNQPPQDVSILHFTPFSSLAGSRILDLKNMSCVYLSFHDFMGCTTKWSLFITVHVVMFVVLLPNWCSGIPVRARKFWVKFLHLHLLVALNWCMFQGQFLAKSSMQIGIRSLWIYSCGDITNLAMSFQQAHFRNWHSKINLLTLKTAYIHKHSKTNLIFEVQKQESTTSTNFRHQNKACSLDFKKIHCGNKGCQNCRNKSRVPERGGICFCKPFVKQHHPSIGVTCPRMPKTMWTKIWNETNQSTTPASIH